MPTNWRHWLQELRCHRPSVFVDFLDAAWAQLVWLTQHLGNGGPRPWLTGHEATQEDALSWDHDSEEEPQLQLALGEGGGEENN